MDGGLASRNRLWNSVLVAFFGLLISSGAATAAEEARQPKNLGWVSPGRAIRAQHAVEDLEPVPREKPERDPNARLTPVERQPRLVSPQDPNRRAAPDRRPAARRQPEQGPAKRASHPATSSEKQDTANSPILRAFDLTNGALDEAQYGEIIQLCQRGIKTSTREGQAAYARRLMAWAHNRRGELRAREGRESEAFADFDAALNLDGRMWRAAHNRGVSNAAFGNYEDALVDFDRVVQLQPEHPNAYFNRGEVQYELGAFAAAVTDYDKAIGQNLRDVTALNSRGHAHFRLGNFRSAMNDFTRVLRIAPEHAAALVNRGDLLAEVGDYARALDDYQRAIRANPKMGRSFQSAAWLLATCPDESLCEPELALKTAQRAIALDGDQDFHYLETLAAAEASTGKYEQAAATQQAALKLAPRLFSDRLRARLALYEQGQAFRESPRETPPVQTSRGPRAQRR